MLGKGSAGSSSVLLKNSEYIEVAFSQGFDQQICKIFHDVPWVFKAGTSKFRH